MTPFQSLSRHSRAKMPSLERLKWWSKKCTKIVSRTHKGRPKRSIHPSFTSLVKVEMPWSSWKNTGSSICHRTRTFSFTFYRIIFPSNNCSQRWITHTTSLKNLKGSPTGARLDIKIGIRTLTVCRKSRIRKNCSSCSILPLNPVCKHFHPFRAIFNNFKAVSS